ncbi:type II secretion system F family protein [Idiomarina sp. UBA3162]|uniref:type II secretion system F family protein n=1 Tax=Idiomarina sp. UBA3162 TaxID=1946641 RepID=UPI000C8BEACA|nr:type II secretion system F family protein [Idiomarina sp. UBA3162]MAD52672.1 MSHA biogenesis protein MshG [Idiomarinaceae bacterium]|tara:strand:+ start:9131 stop:10381 length:1251 start_codon:yes stop_codon:yes gene_type:complete
MQFSYKARDKSGSMQQGTVEANDAKAAAQTLMQRGLIPVDVAANKGKISSTRTNKPSGTLWQRLKAMTEPSVELDQLIIFCRQMYSLTNAGIPILRAIEGLADTTQNKRLERALRDVHGQLERGRTLSAGMSQHPKVFSRLIVAIVHVGENTGQLEESFEQLALYLEKEQDTRKRIKAATRYPTFVMIALVVALFVLNIFVIPTFANMFSRFKVELPWATRALLGTSEFFVAYWPLMLIAMVGAFFGIRAYVNSAPGRLLWDRWKLRMPIIGSILERSILSRFARSFSVMLSAGVPLTQALSLVAEAVDNAHMERKILDIRRTIERGENLSRAARQSKLFTPLVLQMIVVGEETGRSDTLLKEVADYYERETDYDLKTLTARIEPVMIGFVAVLVLILALGIFTPMWDMMNAYQGR